MWAAIAAVVVFAAAAIAVNWPARPREGRAWFDPITMAFTATAAAALFLVTGVIGYTLSKHDRFVAGTAWADDVIWPQVYVGLAFAVVAIPFVACGHRVSVATPSLTRALSDGLRPSHTDAAHEDGGALKG